VHENLSVVMSFAYSRRPLIELIEKKFMGYNKYLEKAIFEIGDCTFQVSPLFIIFNLSYYSYLHSKALEYI
jgi:hypothetical protein